MEVGWVLFGLVVVIGIGIIVACLAGIIVIIQSMKNK